MLAVAASAVLVVGVGALLFASNRDTDGSADQLPQPETTPVATAASGPEDSESILPAVPTVYSATPLGDDVIPVVLPAPAQPVRGNDSGVDFATYAAFAGDDIVARGEPEWGRWQVTADADASPGQDADCRLFQVHVWDIDGIDRSFTDCGEKNPVRPDGTQVYCEVLDVEIVGAVVGTTEGAPVFEVGPDIDGLRAEVEDTSSTEFGESTTFRIVQTEPGADIRSATVLVDGTEIDCNG